MRIEESKTMMDFQLEPDPKDEPTRCDQCHEVLTETRLTSEKEPFCPLCGHTLGHCLQPTPWVCEDCGDIILHHGGDERPWCKECGVPLSCLAAQPSRVYGVGTGDANLELGFALLCEAQDVDLQLGSDILSDMQQK